MNILVINIDDQPQFVGGIKRVCSILGNCWQLYGHKAFFVCWCSSNLKYYDVDGIRQFFLPNIKKIFCDDNIEYLKNFISCNKIDIVLNPFCNVKEVVDLCEKSRVGNTKVISVLHFAPTCECDIVDSNFFIPEKLQFSLRLWIVDFLLYVKWKLWNRQKHIEEKSREFRHIISKSDHLVLLSDKFLDKFPVNCDKNKISVINNPADIPSDISFDKKEKRVCWVGRVEFGAKRVDRVLKVWKIVSARFPDWSLHICGSGNNDFFKTLSEKMKLKNVYFYGFVEDMQNFYSQSRIVCNTSSSEAWGMTLIEGASLGCVPIAFDSFLSIFDVINNGKTGFVINSFDINEFAEKLSLLMSDRDLELAMATRSAEYVKRFSKEFISQKYIDLFQNILNN